MIRWFATMGLAGMVLFILAVVISGTRHVQKGVLYRIATVWVVLGLLIWVVCSLVLFLHGVGFRVQLQ